MHKFFTLYFVFLAGFANADANPQSCQKSFSSLKSNLNKFIEKNPDYLTQKEFKNLKFAEALVQRHGIERKLDFIEKTKQALDRIARKEARRGDSQFEKINLGFIEEINFREMGGFKYLLLFPSYEQARHTLQGISYIISSRDYRDAIKAQDPKLRNFPHRPDKVYEKGRGWKENESEKEAWEDFLGNRYTKLYASTIGEIMQIIVDLDIKSSYDFKKRRTLATRRIKAQRTEEDIKIIRIHQRPRKIYDFKRYESFANLVRMIKSGEIKVTPELIAKENENIIKKRDRVKKTPKKKAPMKPRSSKIEETPKIEKTAPRNLERVTVDKMQLIHNRLNKIPSKKFSLETLSPIKESKYTPEELESFLDSIIGLIEITPGLWSTRRWRIAHPENTGSGKKNSDLRGLPKDLEKVPFSSSQWKKIEEAFEIRLGKDTKK